MRLTLRRVELERYSPGCAGSRNELIELRILYCNCLSDAVAGSAANCLCSCGLLGRGPPHVAPGITAAHGSRRARGAPESAVGRGRAHVPMVFGPAHSAERPHTAGRDAPCRHAAELDVAASATAAASASDPGVFSSARLSSSSVVVSLTVSGPAIGAAAAPASAAVLSVGGSPFGSAASRVAAGTSTAGASAAIGSSTACAGVSLVSDPGVFSSARLSNSSAVVSFIVNGSAPASAAVLSAPLDATVSAIVAVAAPASEAPLAAAFAAALDAVAPPARAAGGGGGQGRPRDSSGVNGRGCTHGSAGEPPAPSSGGAR